MTRILALTLVLLVSAASPAWATNFAVLLGEPPPSGAEPAAIENPLAKPSAWPPNQPIYETLLISVDPLDAWPGKPAVLKLAAGDSLPGNLPAAPAQALVFEVSLFDAFTGDPIHQLPDPLNIWFATTVAPGTKFAFGTLNEGSGIWEQISLITADENGTFCGTTTHLSYFYLAPVPEPSTWALATLGVLFVALTARRKK